MTAAVAPAAASPFGDLAQLLRAGVTEPPGGPWSLRRTLGGGSLEQLTACRDTIKVALGNGALQSAYGSAQLAGAVETIASKLRSERTSQALLDDLPFGIASMLSSAVAATSGPAEAWSAVTRLAMAARRVLDDSAVDEPLTAAHLDRALFLLLSWPFRADPAADRSTHPTLEAFGACLGGIGELAWHARRARERWLRQFLRARQHPVLARWKPADAEREARLLVTDGLGDARRRWARLRLRDPTQNDADAPRPPAVELLLLRGFALPRFMLTEVRQLIGSHDRRPAERWWRALPWALLIAAAAVLVVALVGGFSLVPAAAAGVLGYLAIGVRAVGAGAWATYPFLLRLPASAAIGTLLVLGFGPAGWVSDPQPWTMLLLVAAAYGYLVVEARNHDVDRLAAMRRALAVLLIGLLHALVVAVIAAVTLAPAFLEGFSTISATDGAGMGWFVSLLAAAGLAVGVFAQVLWDDRPVTYPLTHLDPSRDLP